MEDLFEWLERDAAGDGAGIDAALRRVLDEFLAGLDERAAGVWDPTSDAPPPAGCNDGCDGCDGCDGDFDASCGGWAGDAADASAREFAAVEAAFGRAEQALVEANRAAAAQADAIRTALALAARRPELFLPRGAGADRGAAGHGAAQLAQRAAMADLSMRLKISADTLRSRGHDAAVLRERLPELWQRCLDGFLSPADARVAAQAAGVFDAGDERLADLDAALVDLVGRVTSSRFRQRVRELRARLDRASQTERHERALADRRMVVEHLDDGMSWVSLLVSSVDAAKIEARADATARARHGVVTGGVRDLRTLDQLRADAAVDWLTGAGTVTAVRTEVVVTVPVLGLIESEASATDASKSDGELEVLARLEGVGPIDPGTAARLFAEATSFLRLATDPVTGVPLKLGRKRYRPTREQRLWLALRYGRCSRPGCDRLATASDVDHLHEWQHGGRTDDDNLHPSCRGDHLIRHGTRFTVTRSTAGTITWQSPSGYRASTAPGGMSARGPGRDPTPPVAAPAPTPVPKPEPARPHERAEYPDDPTF